MSIEMHQMILFMIFKMNGILAFLFDAEKNKNLLREVVELMVLNWNQLLSKFIFLQKHLLGNT